MASSVLASDHLERPLHSHAASGLGTRGLEPPGVTVGRVPWFLYAVLFASTCVIVGVIWDISWHRTIGRDTFWTSAHLAIYLGGIVSGLTCGWLALDATFGRNAEAGAATVRFWGFRAPFGAWVCIWGAFAMVTSAPFDDWWHNAYGLDVKILSPPHALLASGIAAIQCGAMLMALAWQNRSVASRARLGQLFLFGAGLLLILAAILASEYLGRWRMHRSLFHGGAAAVHGRRGDPSGRTPGACGDRGTGRVHSLRVPEERALSRLGADEARRQDHDRRVRRRRPPITLTRCVTRRIDASQVPPAIRRTSPNAYLDPVRPVVEPLAVRRVALLTLLAECAG
jgi:hypothetical protein